MSDAVIQPNLPQPAAPASVPWLTSRGRARLRFWAGFLTLTGVVAGAGYGVYRYRESRPADVLPSAPARQGDFLVLIRCRGEIQAERSVQVSAPMVPNLRIAWMTPPGQSVKEGETIVKFDSSSATQQLMQKEAALRQAQATLDQALAQSKITSEQDKTELADANFSVERARLEASKQDIVSRLQGEISKIDYGVSQQKLKVQEATVDLHATSDRSKIASLTRQRVSPPRAYPRAAILLHNREASPMSRPIRKNSQPNPRKRAVTKPGSPAGPLVRATRADSKQSHVITMLQAPKGTTIAAITKVTGWQVVWLRTRQAMERRRAREAVDA